MLKRKIFPIIFIIHLFTFSVKGQIPLTERNDNEQKPKFSDRLIIGGNFGLQFGNQTYVEIAPIIGYRVTDKFSAGMNLRYIYYKIHDENYTPPNYSTNIFGGGPFARYFIFENLFLHTEFEILNLDVQSPVTNKYMRQNITSVFVGGGYRQMIGTNSGLDLLLLYNINESSKSPYQNPILRVGFVFGI